ncbi:MAG: ABC transporter ATP-binding protein [Bacteroidales bacterium]|nr:ABC transporter ATP-binding protein [Bacteroidales bacterium]
MPGGIKIENLNFSYTTGNPILKDISLEVGQGEKLGIIGPSGAGKSTLLLHLNGIIAGEGTVRIGDTIVEKKSLPVIRKKMGLVFQNPDDQLFNPTVEEDVAFGPLNFGYNRQEAAYRVSQALKAMNLEGFENADSHHLSLGERKRVALATVLATSPEVIAFDEPFASLDSVMVVQLLDIIEKLDATLVIVSQSLLPLISCCDRLAVMVSGQIRACGQKEEILKNERLMREGGVDMDFYRRVYKKYLA